MTLKMLGNATGVHYTQISKIERGEGILLSKNLRKICEFLSIPTSVMPRTADADELAEKVQALVQSWPQSEKLIWSILEGVQTALEQGSANS